MFGSKDYFFLQGKETLDLKRSHLEFLLKDVWERSDDVVGFYLTAYDFFVKYPGQFDGATIVKDLQILPGLDIHAMIHDYIYLTYMVSANFKFKWYADMIYAREMERMGGSAYSTWSRFAGLTFFGDIFFTPYKKITGAKISVLNKVEFLKIYEMFK